MDKFLAGAKALKEAGAAAITLMSLVTIVLTATTRDGQACSSQ